MSDGRHFVASVLDAACATTRGRGRNDGTADACEDLCIAGRRIRVHWRSETVIEALRPALAPRLEPAVAGAAIDAEIHAWDCVGGAAPPPSPPRDLAIGAVRREAAGPIAAFNRGSGVLVAWDRARGRGAWWCRDARALPQWECASPLRSLLAWLLADHDAAVLHAAAVALDHAALLLVGPGGSGKSTTALRCMVAGFDFLGDNLVAATLEPSPVVHSMYASASLRRIGAVRVRDFRERPTDRAGGAEKRFALPGLDAPERFPASRPLVGIVLPRVSGATACSLHACDSGEAVCALAPSSLLPQPGSDARDFNRMCALVRRLPCVRLELADDGDALPRLHEIIDAALSGAAR